MLLTKQKGCFSNNLQNKSILYVKLSSVNIFLKKTANLWYNINGNLLKSNNLDKV